MSEDAAPSAARSGFEAVPIECRPESDTNLDSVKDEISVITDSAVQQWVEDRDFFLKKKSVYARLLEAVGLTKPGADDVLEYIDEEMRKRFEAHECTRRRR